MANFVCDICGGKLIMQSGGIGVCSQCGMEYSNERLREMAGAAPAKTEEKKIETPVAAAAPVNTEDSKIKNYLTLVETEYNGGFYRDLKTAEGYCDKVLEIDINNFDAWYWKIMINSSSGRNESALSQSAKLYHNENLSAENKAKALALVNEVIKNWRNSYTGSAWSMIMRGIACIVDVEDGNIYEKVAKDALDGLNDQLKNADKRIDEYNEKEYMWKTPYFAGNDGDFVVREVKSVLDTMSNIPEKMYIRLATPMVENYKEALRVYGRLSQMYHTEGSYLEDLKKKNPSDANLAGQIYNLISKVECTVEAEEERLKEVEYQKRLAKGEAYWAKYPEEKKQVEDELEKTSNQWDMMGARLKSLENDSSLESEIKKQIASCKAEMSKLSIFKGKERKAMKEEIAEYEKQLAAAKADRMEKKEELQKEYDALDKKYEDLSNLLIDGR